MACCVVLSPLLAVGISRVDLANKAGKPPFATAPFNHDVLT